MHRTKTCDRCGQELPATETYFDLNLRYADHLKLIAATVGASSSTPFSTYLEAEYKPM